MGCVVYVCVCVWCVGCVCEGCVFVVCGVWDVVCEGYVFVVCGMWGVCVVWCVCAKSGGVGGMCVCDVWHGVCSGVEVWAPGAAGGSLLPVGRAGVVVAG